MVEKMLDVKIVAKQGPWFQMIIVAKDGKEKKMIMREVEEFRAPRSANIDPTE